MAADDEQDRRQSSGRREEDQTLHERIDALLGVGQNIRALQGAVETLASVIGSMATKEDVQEAEVRQDRKRRLGLIGVGVVLLFLVLPLVGQVFVLDEVREVAVQNADNGEVLIECTTPGNPQSAVADDRVHECYEETRARSAALVAEFHLAVLDAATCAVSVPGSEVARCYADRIETRTGTRPSIPAQQ